MNQYNERADLMKKLRDDRRKQEEDADLTKLSLLIAMGDTERVC